VWTPHEMAKISDDDLLLISSVITMLNVLGDEDEDEEDLFKYGEVEDLNEFLARQGDDRKKSTPQQEGKEEGKTEARNNSVLSVERARQLAEHISTSTNAKKIIVASSYNVDNVMEILQQIVRSSSEVSIPYVLDTTPRKIRL
jgi:hypothetical protein